MAARAARPRRRSNISSLRSYLTDAENSNVDITGVEPELSVKVGEDVYLWAMVGAQLVSVNWTLPGNGEVVEYYDPNLATNQLVPLGHPGVGPDSTKQVVSNQSAVTFDFVGGGTFAVSATFVGANGTRTTAYAALTVDCARRRVGANEGQRDADAANAERN